MFVVLGIMNAATRQKLLRLVRLCDTMDDSSKHAFSLLIRKDL